MPRRAPRTTRGRRSKLTPARANHIINLIEAGNHITTAAQTAGIAPQTFFEWLQKGTDAQQAIQNGDHIDPRARDYADFTERVARARAKAETDAVAVVEQVMRGGFLLEEEPVVARDGTLVYGEDGRLLMRRRYAPPDGKLALLYLKASNPQRWLDTKRVEVTGAEALVIEAASNGSAGEALAEDVDRAAAIAARLRENFLAREAEAIEASPVSSGEPGWGEDVQDAEIIESSPEHRR